MPELPEVETIRKGVAQKLKGKKILDIDIKVPKLFIGNKNKIIGAKVLGAKRYSKILQIVLDNNYSILIHLKMTGQLVYKSQNSNLKSQIYVGGHPQKAYEQSLPHKHTHVIYTFDDKSKLYFNDLRKFGWNRVMSNNEVKKYLKSLKLGPEPFSKDFTNNYLKDIFSKTSKNIKDVISDQTKISGLGNIYSNEALYYAGIRPMRFVDSLKDSEINKLKTAIEKVIKLGLKYGGSSQNTYINVEGKKGKYMDYAAVYMQEKDPKGHKVKKIKIGSRTAHYCPKCQK